MAVEPWVQDFVLQAAAPDRQRFLFGAALQAAGLPAGLAEIIGRMEKLALLSLGPPDEPLGLLLVAYREAHPFSPEERSICVAIADMAGNAIQRSGVLDTLEQRVHARTRELETLYHVSTLASASLDLGSILDQSLQMTIQTMRGLGGAIHLFADSPRDRPGAANIAQSRLTLAAQYGLPDDILPHIQTLTGKERFVGSVIEQDKPLVFDTPPLPDSPPGKDFSRLVPTSLIGVPMHAQGRIVGVISVIVSKDDWVRSEDIALLASIADQVGIAVENAGLRRQGERSAVQEERRRLARDLHDSVTQSLYGLNLYARAGRNLAASDDRGKIGEYFGEIEHSALQALKEMRLLIYELRPPPIEQDGLAAAIERRLEAVEQRAGVRAELQVVGEAGLPLETARELYWIIQELLNNSLKHSGASEVQVQLCSHANGLHLSVVDNGRGFNPSALGQGMGLIDIEERAAKIGGRFEIHSPPEGGTWARIEVTAQAGVTR